MYSDTEIAEAVDCLLKLARRHKQNSGLVARDVLLFGTEPAYYPLEVSRLNSLAYEKRISALKIVNRLLMTNHGIGGFLGREVEEQLHAEWYSEQQRPAA